MLLGTSEFKHRVAPWASQIFSQYQPLRSKKFNYLHPIIPSREVKYLTCVSFSGKIKIYLLYMYALTVY